MFRKKKASDYIEPMPRKQLQRICRAFKRHGGEILMSEVIDSYLDGKCVEAVTYNKDLILLHRNPGRAAVFEELMHTAQFRDNKNDGTISGKIKCEIEVQERLIKYATAYGLTEVEIKQTKESLRRYKNDLLMIKRGES